MWPTSSYLKTIGKQGKFEWWAANTTKGYPTISIGPSLKRGSSLCKTTFILLLGSKNIPPPITARNSHLNFFGQQQAISCVHRHWYRHWHCIQSTVCHWYVLSIKYIKGSRYIQQGSYRKGASQKKRFNILYYFFLHVFFYKHNVYKHTEAQISKKLSIF